MDEVLSQTEPSTEGMQGARKNIMLFSIIVPFLNEEVYLGSFLKSLSDEIESASDCEVMLVDNGSVDSSRNIISGYSGMTVLDEPLHDPYLARNRGIEASCGTYLLFLDADCAPRPGWLSAIRQAVDQDCPDILLGDVDYPEPTPSLLKAYRDYYNTKTGWLLKQELRQCYYGHAGNMVVKKSVFEEVGLFRGMPEVGDTATLHDLLAVRPDASINHLPEARVVHLEVHNFRKCLAKVKECGAYTRYYSGTKGFRELRLKEKIQVAVSCMNEQSYGWSQKIQLSIALLMGWIVFEFGCRMPGGKSPNPGCRQEISARPG